MQSLQGGIGGKYWFDQRRGQMTGWNVGVYGLYSSRYDIQWQGGYQGDSYVSAGFSGGYSWRIAKRLNIEFALAAGVFSFTFLLKEK